MTKTYRIACIPGDGIGKEVVPAGQEVLQALADDPARKVGEVAGAGFAAAVVVVPVLNTHEYRNN